jgi:hypothetical protein
MDAILAAACGRVKTIYATHCARRRTVEAVQQPRCAPIIDGLPAACPHDCSCRVTTTTPSAPLRIEFPESLPVSGKRDEIMAAMAGEPGRDRLRRNRLGQDHAVAQDRAGARPRQAQRRAGQGPADRPHAAAPHCRLQRGQAHRRRAEDAAGRRGRLQGALPGPAEPRRLGQADDRRHPAGRDADRSAAQGLRHAHHRRGARAQPEHRLPARLPARDAAAPARPEGDRDLGHHRRRALRAALRLGQGTGADHLCVGPHLPGGAALPPLRGIARARPERRDRRRRRRTLARSRTTRATSSCSCPASARSARRPTTCAAT